ncbi:MAG: hypothetical protein PHC64_02380 [Candidatus Gastranaerophilales bacterium]|nr:hypothetical protein [Candidatus Gastranaerophilales bacterium]
MKKIFAIILILFFFAPSAFAKKKERVQVIEGSGYVGTLPNLNESFNSSQVEEAQPSFEYIDGFNNPEEIKPAPRNNPAFINIIMKKDKTSQYINDLNSLILIVEDLQNLIEDKKNVQLFNAKSYYLKENVEYFRDRYQNKAEASYISYKKLMQLNMHVQALAQLRLENEVYSPYLTANQSGNMFSKNNIDTQLDYLLSDIKGTLVILKEAR